MRMEQHDPRLVQRIPSKSRHDTRWPADSFFFFTAFARFLFGFFALLLCFESLLFFFVLLYLLLLFFFVLALLRRQSFGPIRITRFTQNSLSNH